MYEYRATALRVIDGDTVEFDVDLGLKVRKIETLRLAGIDAPELHSSDPAERERARLARGHLEARLFGEVKNVIVRTEKPYTTDKYGRWLGTVIVGSLNVNEDMIACGHAKPYSGGTR